MLPEMRTQTKKTSFVLFLSSPSHQILFHPTRLCINMGQRRINIFVLQISRKIYLAQCRVISIMQCSTVPRCQRSVSRPKRILDSTQSLCTENQEWLFVANIQRCQGVRGQHRGCEKTWDMPCKLHSVHTSFNNIEICDISSSFWFWFCDMSSSL